MALFRDRPGQAANANPMPWQRASSSRVLPIAAWDWGKTVKRTQAQILYRCKQQIDGKLQTKQPTTAEHLKEMKKYKLRVVASSLSPGCCETCSDSEFQTCFGALMLSTETLPERLFVNVMKRLWGRFVGSHTETWTSQAASVVNLMTPSMANVDQSSAPSPTLTPQEYPAPTALSDIPARHLSSDSRWSVSADFLVEVVLPSLMPDESKAVDVLLALHAHLLPLVAQVVPEGSPVPKPVRNMTECLLVTCAPFQAEPMSNQQLMLLTSLVASDKSSEASPGLAVLAELMSEGWWAQQVRFALQHCMLEVQHGARATAAVEALSGDVETPETVAAQPRAWDTITSEFPTWQQKMRPQATQTLVKAMRVNLERRVANLRAETDSTECSEVVRLSSWAAEATKSEEWLALRKDAAALVAELAAGTRWEEAMSLATSLERLCGKEAAADEDSHAARSSAAADVETALKDCMGQPVAASEQERLGDAVETCLCSAHCTAAVAAACAAILQFAPGRTHSLALCNAVKAGLAVVGRGSTGGTDAAGGGSDPAAKRHALQEALQTCEKASKHWEDTHEGKGMAIAECVGVWAQIRQGQREAEQALQEFASEVLGDVLTKMRGSTERLKTLIARVQWRQSLGSGAFVESSGASAPAAADVSWPQIVHAIQYKFWQPVAAGQKTSLESLEEAYTEADDAQQQYNKCARRC